MMGLVGPFNYALSRNSRTKCRNILGYQDMPAGYHELKPGAHTKKRLPSRYPSSVSGCLRIHIILFPPLTYKGRPAMVANDKL